MNSFFKSLQLKRDKLSNLEQQVMNYILENPDMIEQNTIEELSKILFVSTATISRTCKKLGFSGFQELKYSLASHKDTIDVEKVSVQDHSIMNHIQRFETEFNDNISQIGASISDEVIDLIENSNHVEFFGVGASLPICIEAARKMTFAGRIATARSDWDELRVVAQNMKETDLAVVVSLSGETLHIIEYANILKENNVPMITLTGNKNNHLIELGTHTLYAELQAHYYGKVDMSSRFLLNMILDLLLLEYIQRKKA